MRTLRLKLDEFVPEYPLDQIAPWNKILFLDIETTGFAAKSSCLYLIGCAYYAEGAWYIMQWFADQPQEEKGLLEAFFKFASRFTHLIHFNGNNFDLPFLLQKCSQYGLPYNFEQFQGVDLYKRVAPYKYFLKLPNCKQKTIELFLGINRDDPYNGGELIDVYRSYIQRPTDLSLEALITHNSDDIRGMLNILPILSYCDLFNGNMRAKRVQANYYKDCSGIHRREILIKLKFTSPLPVPVSFNANGCYFSGSGTEGNLKVPLYEEEMKYFYSNYKDYYYLPDEDLAMHKSVATFVDREHRVQATPATCYTRKISSYLPQWDILYQPFFKREYKSREIFFELTEEFKTNRLEFTRYASHILNMMSTNY